MYGKREEESELRRSTEGNVLPLSNGITRIVPIYSNRLNTSSIAREYRGIPRNFSRTSTTDFPSKMAAPLPSAPPSLANSFANRKTDFFPRSVTQTVRKISIESGQRSFESVSWTFGIRFFVESILVSVLVLLFVYIYIYSDN